MPGGTSPSWRRSTFCANGTCLEVADLGDSVLVRDSKNPDSAHLRFSIEEWEIFCGAVASGEFTYS